MTSWRAPSAWTPRRAPLVKEWAAQSYTLVVVSAFDEACRDRLTPSRRYEAGAGGVRGMLTSILGEFARRTGEPTPSAALIDVLGRFGVGEATARQALLRAAKDGWFVRMRDGRRTLWQLSRPFEQFLDGGEAKIYGFRAVQTEWD